LGASFVNNSVKAACESNEMDIPRLYLDVQAIGGQPPRCPPTSLRGLLYNAESRINLWIYLVLVSKEEGNEPKKKKNNGIEDR
jgi:hypothetical protein